MADNYLYATRIDPFQSLLQGFGAGQNIMGNINQQQAQNIKNEMLSRELEKQKAVGNALANYGQEGFNESEAIKAVMPHDPELGIKIANIKKQATAEQLKLMGSAAEIGQKVAPSLLNNFQGYVDFWKNMSGMGMGQFMPHPLTMIDKQTGQPNMDMLNETVKRIGAGSNMFLEEYKQSMKVPETKPFQIGEKVVQHQYNQATKRWEPMPGMEGPKWNEDSFIVGTSPDGKPYMIKTKGGDINKTLTNLPGFEKTTSGKLEEGIMAETDMLRALNDISQQFNPDFLKYEGQLRGWISGKAEKAGIGLSDENREFLNNYTAFRASAGKLLADRLKAMSGSAVTEPEMQRQKIYLPDAEGDSPTQLQSKIVKMRDFGEKATARLNYFRNNGFSIKNSEDLQNAINKSGVTLDNVKDVLVKRAIQLRKEGKTADETSRIIVNEFGIMP